MKTSKLEVAVVLGFLVLIIGSGWWCVRPLSPRPFEAAAWQADMRGGKGYIRMAMADDLARRMVAERWDAARVSRETTAGDAEPRQIGLGMRSPVDGSYYMDINYDAEGRVVNATVRPS